MASKGTRFLKIVFVLVGAFLVSLSVLLPVLMENATNHRGLTPTFGSIYLRVLSPFVTVAAMASSFIAAAAILSFEKSRPSHFSVLLGIMTLSVFVAEIVLSAYVSTVHPLPATTLAPLAIYVLMGLVPLGLACTLFTIASMLSYSPRS